MTDIDLKRAYVSDLYPGIGWKHKVSKMPDDQIIAIYLKHQDDGQPPESYSEHDEPKSPEVQPLVEISQVSHGPHANEDEFLIY